MKGVIDFGQFGLEVNYDGNTIPVDSDTVFTPYHTHITGRGKGLIGIGHPPYDNNILIENVVESLFSQLQDHDQIPKDQESFGKEVVKYLVSNTLKNKGDGKRGICRRESYELRLIKAALAVERYFQTPLIDDPEGRKTVVDKVSRNVEEILSCWLRTLEEDS